MDVLIIWHPKNSRIRLHFVSAGFAFDSHNLKLDSGEEDGMFRWLSLVMQWKRKRLHHQPAVSAVHFGKYGKQLGVIEFARLTSRITFQPEDQHGILQNLQVNRQSLCRIQKHYFGNSEI